MMNVVYEPPARLVRLSYRAWVWIMPWWMFGSSSTTSTLCFVRPALARNPMLRVCIFVAQFVPLGAITTVCVVLYIWYRCFEHLNHLTDASVEYFELLRRRLRGGVGIQPLRDFYQSALVSAFRPLLQSVVHRRLRLIVRCVQSVLVLGYTILLLELFLAVCSLLLRPLARTLLY
jgi:hypothetical protein